MAVRCAFENSSDVGVFATLTNKYCLVADGGSENFYSVFEGELADHIPVVHTLIGGAIWAFIFKFGIYLLTNCFNNMMYVAATCVRFVQCLWSSL